METERTIYTPGSTEDIWIACYNAVQQQMYRTESSVEFEFNGVHLLVEPGDSPFEPYKAYMKTMGLIPGVDTRMLVKEQNKIGAAARRQSTTLVVEARNRIGNLAGYLASALQSMDTQNIHDVVKRLIILDNLLDMNANIDADDETERPKTDGCESGRIKCDTDSEWR